MKATFRANWLGVALCLAVGGVSGCADRMYLTKTHGRAYSDAFAQQKVYPAGAPAAAKGTQGLDSQEAAAVAGAYRRSLSKDAANEASGPQLVMTNPAAAGMAVPNMPPPSVPSSQ
jgi:hypothetical protein